MRILVGKISKCSKIVVITRTFEDPFFKVGSCALDHDNRVIGVAYNGLAPGKVAPPGFWDDRDKRRPFMIHSEANLLALIKRGECRIIACNLLPCSSCATNIVAHGMQRDCFIKYR